MSIAPPSQPGSPRRVVTSFLPGRAAARAVDWPTVTSVAAIAALAVADAFLPSVQLGVLAAVPLIVIATRVGARTASIVAVFSALTFGMIDYGSIFQEKFNAFTLPFETLMLIVTFGAIVLAAGRLECERRKALRLERELASAECGRTAEHERARTDALTQLPNRLAFEEALLRMTGETGPPSVAVIFLDLNGFKAINDECGHDVGDEVLRLTAQRIIACVRPGDIVGRIGGDEFVVICGGRSAEEIEAARVAAGIEAALSQPIAIGGFSLAITAGSGIAHWPGDASDPADIVRVADRRMYLNKTAAKAARSTPRLRPAR